MKKLARNWSKTSAAQKRVLIAKDALAQLKAGKLEAKRGTWGEVSSTGECLAGLLHPELDLREIALTKSCDACAGGALLLSAIRYRDNCSSFRYNELREFSNHQRVLIEIAFELGQGVFEMKSMKGTATAWEFGKQYYSDRIRLRAILENIIENEGTFTP